MLFISVTCQTFICWDSVPEKRWMLLPPFCLLLLFLAHCAFKKDFRKIHLFIKEQLLSSKWVQQNEWITLLFRVYAFPYMPFPILNLKGDTANHPQEWWAPDTVVPVRSVTYWVLQISMMNVLNPVSSYPLLFPSLFCFVMFWFG